MTDFILPDSLKNEQIWLEPLRESDFERLYAVASDPEIWEQHPSPDRYKKEVFQKFFDGAVDSQSAFLIIDQETNEVIGSTRFYEYDKINKSIAIGYTFLAKEYWGGKYNSSVKKLMLDYAFQFAEKVYFHVGASNIRSQTAVLRLGAQLQETVMFDHYGEKVEHHLYVLEKNNWLQQNR